MLKFGFLLRNSSYLRDSPVMSDVFRLLRSNRVAIEVIAPDRQIIELRNLQPRCDLYILKPGEEANLSLAGVLHRRGARILNEYPACALVHDKIQVTCQLLQARLPVPESFVCGDAKQVLLATGYSSVIAKPHRGSYGEGVCTVDSQQPLATSAPQQSKLVQQRIPSNGEDTKVYVIGEEVMAIKRRFPVRTPEERFGRPCSVDPQTRKIALQIGRLFGLEIYGVDFIETDQDGPFIIDVNYFPSFIGIPRAAILLTDYILGYARQQRGHGPASPLAATLETAPHPSAWS